MFPDHEAQHESHHRFAEGEEAPPKGVRIMAIVRWLLLVAMAAAAMMSAYGYVHAERPGSAQGHAHYHCPMHPQITSDRPGECPICHMALEPIADPKQATIPAPAAPNASSVVEAAGDTKRSYTCPMHPEIHSDAPGRCPKCGMDLVPEKTPPPPHAEATPPGTTKITLTLDRLQAIGVRTARAERKTDATNLRVTAAVEVPEQSRAEVHVRSAGFVEAIAVRDVGLKVKAGEVLASVYSPEVYQAQQELLTVNTWAGPAPAGGTFVPPTEAARKRLELLGVSQAVIDRIVSKREPIRALGISSPISGYVVRKEAVLGSYVTPDRTLFEIADLSRVYVIANLYLHQLAVVRPGDTASFTTPSLPERTFAAEVDLIYPVVDLATRTARVRFRVDNKDLALRPGQFGVAEIHPKNPALTSLTLTVPTDAIIDTGKSVYVFVARDDGSFEARTVEIGEILGDRSVVTRGLSEGERVVSGATFLIDAESRLEASLAAASHH